MSSVRKIAVDELSEAHAKLSEEYSALAAKHQGAKARVRTLEAESGACACVCVCACVCACALQAMRPTSKTPPPPV